MNMGIYNRFRLASLLVVVIIFGSYLVPYSYSKGVSQFTLYGNVIDGSTCNPISGALVTAPYNYNTSNLTNSTGGYLLRLGFGNWTVTVSKSDYTPISFDTPYVATGSYQFNTYLLVPGATPANCTEGRHATNSTVPTTVTAESTISTILTTVPSNNTGQNTQNTPTNYNTALTGAAIVVIIIIVLAYFALRKKPPERKVAEHKKA